MSRGINPNGRRRWPLACPTCGRFVRVDWWARMAASLGLGYRRCPRCTSTLVVPRPMPR